MNVRYSRAVRLSNSARSSGTTPTRRLTVAGGVGRGKIGAQNPHRAAGRRQQAGEHLDGGRFARAVRAEKADRTFPPRRADRAHRPRAPLRSSASTRSSQRQASLVSLSARQVLLESNAELVTGTQDCGKPRCRPEQHHPLSKVKNPFPDSMKSSYPLNVAIWFRVSRQ